MSLKLHAISGVFLCDQPQKLPKYKTFELLLNM